MGHADTVQHAPKSTPQRGDGPTLAEARHDLANVVAIGPAAAPADTTSPIIGVNAGQGARRAACAANRGNSPAAWGEMTPSALYCFQRSICEELELAAALDRTRYETIGWQQYQWPARGEAYDELRLAIISDASFAC